MLLSGPASKAYVINLHSRNSPVLVLYTAYHSHSHNYMTPVVQYVQWSTEMCSQDGHVHCPNLRDS